MDPSQHIALTISNDYVNYALVLLTSFCQHASKRSYHVHIFSENLSLASRACISYVLHSLRRRYHSDLRCSFHIVRQELDSASAPPAESHLSREVFLRLRLASLLPKVDRLLYLDADTLCTGSLDELFAFDLGEKLIAGALDPYMYKCGMHHTDGIDQHLEQFGLEPAPYINAGVLLMNLKRMRDEHLEEQFASEMYARPHAFYDQDIINIVLQGKIAQFDARFNLNVGLFEADAGYLDLDIYENTIQAALADPRIIHFVGPIKPWNLTKEQESQLGRQLPYFFDYKKLLETLS